MLPSQQPAAVTVADLVCGQCGVPALAHCARCRLVVYCSSKCQRAAWPAHKPTCSIVARAAPGNAVRGAAGGGTAAAAGVARGAVCPEAPVLAGGAAAPAGGDGDAVWRPVPRAAARRRCGGGGGGHGGMHNRMGGGGGGGAPGAPPDMLDALDAADAAGSLSGAAAVVGGLEGRFFRRESIAAPGGPLERVCGLMLRLGAFGCPRGAEEGAAWAAVGVEVSSALGTLLSALSPSACRAVAHRASTSVAALARASPASPAACCALHSATVLPQRIGNIDALVEAGVLSALLAAIAAAAPPPAAPRMPARDPDAPAMPAVQSLEALRRVVADGGGDAAAAGAATPARAVRAPAAPRAPSCTAALLITAGVFLEHGGGDARAALVEADGVRSGLVAAWACGLEEPAAAAGGAFYVERLVRGAVAPVPGMVPDAGWTAGDAGRRAGRQAVDAGVPAVVDECLALYARGAGGEAGRRAVEHCVAIAGTLCMQGQGPAVAATGILAHAMVASRALASDREFAAQSMVFLQNAAAGLGGAVLDAGAPGVVSLCLSVLVAQARVPSWERPLSLCVPLLGRAHERLPSKPACAPACSLAYGRARRSGATVAGCALSVISRVCEEGRGGPAAHAACLAGEGVRGAVMGALRTHAREASVVSAAARVLVFIAMGDPGAWARGGASAALREVRGLVPPGPGADDLDVTVAHVAALLQGVTRAAEPAAA